jgi:transglutaminase-like putative cysteine protease
MAAAAAGPSKGDGMRPSRNTSFQARFTFKARVISVVAQATLIPLLWTMLGVDSLAQTTLARMNPASMIDKLVADPRLHLSEQQVSSLKTAAAEARAAVHSPTPAIRHATHPERQAVQDEQEVVNDLRRLAAEVKAGTVGRSFKRHYRRIRQRLTDSHRRIVAGFAAASELLASAGLDDTFRQRESAHRALYMMNWRQLRTILRRAEHSRTPESMSAELDDAIALLNTTHDQRPQQPFDPKRLPFATSKPTRETRTAPPALLSPENSPAVDVAAQALATPPGPADLAATEDVQITQAIRDLAASLGNQPVAIYYWLKNNIDFHPTYGSVQGSQLTLEMKRGNATDIAALLIALLRAAGIASRFATGTVVLPASSVINWLGNVPDASFAQQVMGAGGIPNVALVDGGGQIRSFRIDHVWVEAYVDMIPSRGAVHVAGDTWVRMDAAFKQYNVTPSSSLIANMPINGAVTQIQNSLTVDPALGALTGIDEEQTVTVFEDWVNDATTYMDTHSIGYDPVSILGGKSIVVENGPVIQGTLPYQVHSSAAAAADLPASLRNTVEIVTYSSELDRAFGSPDFSFSVSLPSLGSKRLGLTFDPATPGDEAVLQAARDAGASSLPISSVNVIPKLLVDDVTMASGGTLGMGRDYFVDVTMRGPGELDQTLPYNVVAGDEIVVGVTGNGFLPDVLQKRLENHPVTTSAEYLHQVNLHYWTETDFLNGNSAMGIGGVIFRLPSVGLFSSPLTVSYLFGQPYTGVYASKFMDVKWSFVGAAAATPAQRVSLVKVAGFNGSYMEGTTFDQFETAVTGTPRIKAIDSMQLLSAAQAQGVPLYRITPANRAAVLPLLNLDASVESDIANALAQGQTVLAPGSNIDIGPWSGAGYILQNENTGEGAYLISGGLSGGGLPDCIEELVKKVVLVLAIIAVTIFALILLYFLLTALVAVIAELLAAGAAAEAFAALVAILRGLAPLAV